MKYFYCIILGFLINLSCIAQTPCDSTGSKIWSALENPPNSYLSDEELEIAMNSSINLDQQGVEGVSYIYLLYYVNCKGESFKYELALLRNGRTSKDSTSTFSNSIIEFMKSAVQFEPGFIMTKRKNKETKLFVDSQGAYTISIKDDRFHVLDEKQKAKHFKKKSKNK